MANRRSCCVSTIVTGITAITDNSRVGVVGIGWQKTYRCMTGVTFSDSDDMVGVLTYGYSIVMASRA